jgi:hypothetical protein
MQQRDSGFGLMGYAADGASMFAEQLGILAAAPAEAYLRWVDSWVGRPVPAAPKAPEALRLTQSVQPVVSQSLEFAEAA